MNTNTGEVYECQKKRLEDIELTEEQAEILKTLEPDSRTNYLVNSLFDDWYFKKGYNESNATRLRMRIAFRGGFDLREDSKIKEHLIVPFEKKD